MSLVPHVLWDHPASERCRERGRAHGSCERTRTDYCAIRSDLLSRSCGPARIAGAFVPRNFNSPGRMARPVPLYQGPMFFNADPSPLGGQGRVVLRWDPHPVVMFEITADHDLTLWSLARAE